MVQLPFANSGLRLTDFVARLMTPDSNVSTRLLSPAEFDSDIRRLTFDCQRDDFTGRNPTNETIHVKGRRSPKRRPRSCWFSQGKRKVGKFRRILQIHTLKRAQVDEKF